VLFGTDTPWTRPKQELARLRALPLTAEEIDFIVSANAAELLGLGTV